MNLCHRYTDSFDVFRWLHVPDSWVLVNWVLTKYQYYIYPNDEEVVAVFCIFWPVFPYVYKKSMEIIVQKRDKTSAVSVIHVYLRCTDLIFLLADSHFSYSRSMIWQKFFGIFSFLQWQWVLGKKTTLQVLQWNFHPTTVFDFILSSKQFWKYWTRQFDDLSVRKDVKRGNIWNYISYR